MRGYEALAECLVAEGVTTVFGVFGGDNDNWVHRADALGVRYVPARHEQGAVGMADGWARATGDPGVATVTLGPGLTNAVTPMTAARLSGTPVVVIVGEARPGDGEEARFGNMIIDQEPLLRGSIGRVERVTSADRLDEHVRRAFHGVREGAGPVALVVPWPVLDHAELPEPWSYRPSTRTLPAPPAPAASDAALRALADELRGARRPLLLVGRGALGAERAVARLGEQAGALFATTLAARGLLDAVPGAPDWSVGVCGGFSEPAARALLESCDLVLALGADLNHWTLDRGRLFEKARVMAVNHDRRRAFDLESLVDDVVVADVADVAARLSQLLGEDIPGGERRSAELAERLRAARTWTFAPVEEDGLIDPRRAVQVLGEELPADRTCVVDIGNFMSWPAAHFPVPGPRDLVLPWRLGAMGCSLPVAVGVAQARPDRTTVSFIGDGGLMALIPELDTAVRAGSRLVVVCLDDGGYGAERYGCVVTGKPTHLVDFVNPDLEALARSLGMGAATVRSEEELRAAVRSLVPPHGPAGPVLLRVMVPPTVFSEELYRAMTDFRARRS